MFRHKQKNVDRSAELDRLVAQFAHQLATGGELDMGSVQDQHRHLMPELGERLRSLPSFGAAVRRADEIRRLPNTTDAVDPRNALFAEELEVLREVLPEYDFVELIHHGGQGVVYQAVEKTTNRTVAVKVLLDGLFASQRQRSRFDREVELVSRMRHPNIVTLYHSGIVRGRPFFAMEYVDGLPVDDDALHRKLSGCDIAGLFANICHALTYAHQRGIIHRDLKPSNILVDGDGEPHVLDFGFAKDVGSADSDDSGRWLTDPGRPVGTLPYGTPEQLGKGGGEIDTRSDIYSLAVVLFQVLSGRFPYPVAGDPPSVYRNILEYEPDRLGEVFVPSAGFADAAARGINDDLEAILFKALEKDRSRRYQTMEAFAEDLQRYAAGEAVLAKADRRLYVFRKALRKYRVHVSIAASFILVIVVAGILVATQWARAARDRDIARDKTRIARETAQVAHEALIMTLGPFIEGLARLPGGIEVRDRLLDDIEDPLDHLGTLLQADDSMVELRSALHGQRGKIARAQGYNEDAHQEYTILVGMLRAQVDEEPSMARRRALVEALWQQARLSPDWDSLFAEAITRGIALIQEAPEDEELERIVCEARVAYAVRLSIEGQKNRAADQIKACLALAQPFRGPLATGEWMEIVAGALELEGDIHLSLGQGEVSVAAYEEALQIREFLIQDRPTDVVRRNALATSRIKLAFIKWDTGELDAARHLLERAVEVGIDLLDADPGYVHGIITLYAAYDGLARLSLEKELHNLQRAEQCSELALQLMQNLPEEDSDHSLWRGKLGMAHKLRGIVLVELKRFAEAHRNLSDAVGEFEAQRREDSDDQVVIAHLANALDRLGNACKELGLPTERLEHYRRSYRLRRELCEASPEVVRYAEFIIVSQTKIGEWYLQQDTPEDDRLADQWYSLADVGLRTLEDAGQLVGREAKFRGWREDIDTQREKLDKRLSDPP